MRPPRPLHTENRPPYATVLNRALQGSLYFLCSLLYRGKAVISLGGASGVRVWIGKIRARRFFIVPRGRRGARLCVSPPENRRSSCAMLPRHACFTDFCSASLKAYPRRSTEKMPRVRHSRGRRRRVRRFASARARPDGRERPSNPPRPQKRPLWPAITLCRTETLIEFIISWRTPKMGALERTPPRDENPWAVLFIGKLPAVPESPYSPGPARVVTLPPRPFCRTAFSSSAGRP